MLLPAANSTEWPQFGGNGHAPGRSASNRIVSTPSLETQTVPLTGRSPTIDSLSPRVANGSPAPGSDSISSLTRSVPGTPQLGFGGVRSLGAGLGNGYKTGGLNSPGVELANGSVGGLERGFSNPDLTKAFGRAMGSFQKGTGDDFGPLSDDVSS